jgi:hypothetical protein
MFGPEGRVLGLRGSELQNGRKNILSGEERLFHTYLIPTIFPRNLDFFLDKKRTYGSISKTIVPYIEQRP